MARTHPFFVVLVVVATAPPLPFVAGFTGPSCHAVTGGGSCRADSSSYYRQSLLLARLLVPLQEQPHEDDEELFGYRFKTPQGSNDENNNEASFPTSFLSIAQESNNNAKKHNIKVSSPLSLAATARHEPEPVSSLLLQMPSPMHDDTTTTARRRRRRRLLASHHHNDTAVAAASSSSSFYYYHHQVPLLLKTRRIYNEYEAALVQPWKRSYEELRQLNAVGGGGDGAGSVERRPPEQQREGGGYCSSSSSLLVLAAAAVAPVGVEAGAAGPSSYVSSSAAAHTAYSPPVSLAVTPPLLVTKEASSSSTTLPTTTKRAPASTTTTTSTGTTGRATTESYYYDWNATSFVGGDVMCRVVAGSDRKLDLAHLPFSIRIGPPHLYQRLDKIYQAQAHLELSMSASSTTTTPTSLLSNPQKEPQRMLQRSGTTEKDQVELEESSQSERADWPPMLRTSLEEAGFQLLSRRDLDLCEALNAEYLLRLSILPDTTTEDPDIAQEFYPEHFDAEGKVKKDNAAAQQWTEQHAQLFDGRVLVFWRGYSNEVTRGRMLLTKVDYLQASIVQRLSGRVKRGLGYLEQTVVIAALGLYRRATACYLHYVRSLADRLCSHNVPLRRRLRRWFRQPFLYSAYRAVNGGRKLPTVAQLRANGGVGGVNHDRYSLARYGGSKIRFVGSPNPMDALNPFIICEEDEKIMGGPASSPKSSRSSSSSCCTTESAAERAERVDRNLYNSLNDDVIRCPYDRKNAGTRPAAVQLLNRVSISNLVDIYTRQGRQEFFDTFLEKSELVEPTYEEVVVVWRPLPDTAGSSSEEEKQRKKEQRSPRLVPPKIVYELADMFDFVGVLPEKPKQSKVATPPPKPPKPPRRMPLEIRTFSGVPMANLPAVLPKTKLVFRPADALAFDLVVVANILTIAGSIRFDSPRLDLLALVSVCLFSLRTFFRYKNKFARYELLVKNFLTSKISHRNLGALKYLASEAGSQRAARAALVHQWLCEKVQKASSDGLAPLRWSDLVRPECGKEVSDLLSDLKATPIDVEAALNDLEELNLLSISEVDGEKSITVVQESHRVVERLKQTWGSLFEGSSSLRGTSLRQR